MRARDRGAGAILVLAAIAVLGMVGLLGVGVVRALTVRHEVAAAADLAALAAASAGCGQAERVAGANDVSLLVCVVEGDTVRVEVARSVRWWGGASAVNSSARAGPVSDAASRSTRSSNRTAPALSSGLFPLPHLGDCTQEGQPVEHSQESMALRVARSHSSAVPNPRSAKPAPPG